MKHLFAVVLSLFATNLCAGGSKPEPAQESKTIVIDGEISGRSMGPIYSYVNGLLAQQSVPENLDIVISSPGGSVTAGFLFLDRLSALKQRGTKVNCYVAEVAASMAFQILTQCDTRTSLETSFLLWHRARVFVGGMFGTAMTGPMAYQLGVQLKDLDDHIYRDVKKAMPSAPDHYLRFHFEAETLHTGANLAAAVPEFLTISDDSAWIMGQLTNPDAVHLAKATLFDTMKFGDLIYIWDRALTRETKGEVLK